MAPSRRKKRPSWPWPQPFDPGNDTSTPVNHDHSSPPLTSTLHDHDFIRGGQPPLPARPYTTGKKQTDIDTLTWDWIDNLSTPREMGWMLTRPMALFLSV